MRLILQVRDALPVEASRPVPIQVITPLTCRRSANGWLLIGNRFLENDILWKVTENTILSQAARRHMR
jgi:hypothetical protein